MEGGLPIWYFVALLIAPLTQTTVLLSLSLFSPRFLPAIVLSNQKIALLVSGISVGLMGVLVEELGWTGFAISRLRLRHTVFSTGLLVGVLWGLWHLLQMWWVGRTSSEGISLIIFMPQYFISAIIQLTAFRVLMVWVYDHTRSLLLSILMHASYIFSTLFFLAPPITGIPFIIYSWVFAASLLIIVGVAALLDRGMHALPENSQEQNY